MHPAFSVIFFTTASGAGYGLLTMLGIGFVLQMTPGDEVFAVAALATALLLVSAGLLSSTFHLGHPERAWRALSQWRSSWLSREGVLALLSYIPVLVLASGWLVFKSEHPVYTLAAGLMSLLCVLTVYSTAMIYATLRTVQAWCNHWVPAVYLGMALMTGMLIINTLVLLCAVPSAVVAVTTLAAISIAFLTKLGYWHYIDTVQSPSTAATATGLGHPGKVRLTQSPHSQDNYLLKEMGYQVARRHARKLRRLCLLAGFVLPFVLTLPSLQVKAPVATLCAVLAVIVAIPGVLIERWLFFAEARHSVMLYYGRATA